MSASTVLSRELLGDERPEQVHAGLLVGERLRRLLPGEAQGVRVLVGQQGLPVVEDVVDLLLVPASPCGRIRSMWNW